MMDRHSGFGFSSILLSFVMICILTFSALALVTANSDYRLSKKVEANNTAFYAAERESYRTLALIDGALAEAYEYCGGKDSYCSYIETELVSLCGGWLRTDGDDYLLTYTKPVSDNRYLSVTLRLRYPDKAIHSFYEIREWKSVLESEYVEDAPLRLIGSE